MPRSTATKSLESHIGSIIGSAASAIATAVRQEMTSEIQRLLASRAASGRAVNVKVPSVKVAVAKGGKGKATARTGKPRGGAGQKRNVPKSCIYPNCTNPSKGPRWSFMCDKHKDAPKAERTKLLAQWKSQQGGAAAATPAPKKATAKPGPKPKKKTKGAKAKSPNKKLTKTKKKAA
jgi:hypothetical protein